LKHFDDFYLFNLAEDYHEVHDLKAAEANRFASMLAWKDAFEASLLNSQYNESGCAAKAPSPAPGPLPPPSSACAFTGGEGIKEPDASMRRVASKEECCGVCRADALCTGSTFFGGECHVKHGHITIATGRSAASFVCVPTKWERGER
jgi:hypothetical protein